MHRFSTNELRPHYMQPVQPTASRFSTRIRPIANRALVVIRESLDPCSSLDGGCFDLPLPRFSLDLGVPACM